MVRIHAEGADSQRIEDRRGDKNQNAHIHEAAQHDHQHEHEKDDDVGIMGNAENGVAEELRHFEVAHNIAERVGAGDDRQRHCHDRERGEEGVYKLLESQRLVNKNGDQQSVNSGDSCGLGRGADTAGGADNDDDDSHQTGQSLKDDPQLLSLSVDDHDGVVALLCDYERGDAQAEREKNAGHVAADKQSAYRQSAARRHGIEQHVLAGRDHDALKGGSNGNGNGVVRVVALIHHCGDKHCADGGNVRGGAAGDAAEEHGDDNVHQCRASSDAADDKVAEVHELLGDAAVAHDLCHDDEERSRDYDEALHARDHLHEDVEQGDIKVERADDRRDTEREGYGYAQADKHQERAEKNKDAGCNCAHTFSPPFSVSFCAALSSFLSALWTMTFKRFITQKKTTRTETTTCAK